jgi:hypothetical protein
MPCFSQCCQQHVQPSSRFPLPAVVGRLCQTPGNLRWDPSPHAQICAGEVHVTGTRVVDRESPKKRPLNAELTDEAAESGVAAELE